MVADCRVFIDIVMLAGRITWSRMLRVAMVEGTRALVLRVGGGDARLLAPQVPEVGDESRVERERVVDCVVDVMSVLDEVIDDTEHRTAQEVELPYKHYHG